MGTKEKCDLCNPFKIKYLRGPDGTRTRDLRRDRAAF